MVTIDTFLREATNTLRDADIASSRLDALVLLADALDKNKAWLLAHGDEHIPSKLFKQLQDQINHRKAREPLSYIRGKQEFYGRAFIVTPDVLIPRPETEALIEQLLALDLPQDSTVLDVGTGSGVIAVTVKLERPDLIVHALDISEKALIVARQNALKLNADIAFIQSDLLQDAHSQPADAILANLPYVDRDWERSPETNFEPELALFADNKGRALIFDLIKQAAPPKHLKRGGYIVLEADPMQHESISFFAAKLGFKNVGSQDYALVLRKA
jgi:release factor glutamine methyltransferase